MTRRIRVPFETIPWSTIELLFVDAGNVLVSVDFAWIAAELAARGFVCDAHELERAEAAGRPRVSARLARRSGTETRGAFLFYLETMIAGVDAAAGWDPSSLDELVREVAAVVREPGQADRLWRRVLPGVPRALERLRGLGLRLAVVSNSDGSVERSLRSLGLRDSFEHVHDSKLVGFEKPDRRLFEHALACAGATPSRTVHVGDMVAADVAGARSAGIHPVLLDPFDDWSDVDCVRVETLGALADRLAAVLGHTASGSSS